MNTSIARYLKDFGEPLQVPPVAAPDDCAPEGFDGFAVFPIEDPIDVEDERRKAHCEGYEAATLDMQTQMETLRQEMAAAHASEIAHLQERFETDVAGRIANDLQQIAILLTSALSNQVATFLAPIMGEELTQKAVADLARSVEASLSEAHGAVMTTVRGPARLFKALQDHMGERAGAFVHVEADDIDLSVEIGEAVLVTRMSAWAASIRKVLE